jgi:NADP-dependent 3-hydroxy acid dehydrogenase YdfG
VNDTGPSLRPGAIALVTGASSGIGEATAQRLAARGARVICAARRVERLQALVAPLGDQAIALPLDVNRADDVARFIERLPATWRAIDILVNNAGHDIHGRRRFVNGTIADWAAIVETNTVGLMRVAHAVLPGMLERARGHIVNIGSSSAFNILGDSAYIASKAAVHGLSQAWRSETLGRGVRVTEVIPGPVRTEFAAARLDGDVAGGEAFYRQFKAVIEADDVARAIVYALEQPGYMTVTELAMMPSA